MKKRLLVTRLPQPGKSVELSENEAHHATRVLRIREGDVVQVLDGKGHTGWGTLRMQGAGVVKVEFAQISEPLHASEGVIPVVLEAAVIKGAAMDWLIEKAVELGVQKFVPLLTIRTVIKMDRKSPGEFRERWQKIADQSIKQCGRLNQMEILDPLEMETLVTRKLPPRSVRFWCDEVQDSAPSLISALGLNGPVESQVSSRHLMVGPEGGWDPRERVLLEAEASTVRVSLGPLVMRAETASIFGVSVISAWVREVERS